MSIQPAIYRIKNAKSQTYFDASLQAPGELHGWENHPENQNQKWIVEPSGQGYTLKNVETGGYATACGSENGTRVEVSGNDTEWIIQDRNGVYSIGLAGTEAVCDLDMGRSEDGTGINIWSFTGAEQQTWCFEQVGEIPGGAAVPQPPTQEQAAATYSGPIPPGQYCVQNNNAGTAIDLAGAGTADGTPVIGWQVNKGTNQLWDLIAGQNGFQFKNVASGTFLGFAGEGIEGTFVSGSQNPVEWQVSDANGVYQIHYALNPTLVMDLAGGGSQDGVKILLWTNHSGENQMWKFEAT